MRPLASSRTMPAGGGIQMAERTLRFAAVLASLLWAANAVAAETVTVAILRDGPLERELFPVEVLRAAAESVLAGEPRLELPEALRRDGGWTREGINRALDELLADPRVDIIITLGLLSSNQAAQRAK